jgi:hypothetical protein
MEQILAESELTRLANLGWEGVILGLALIALLAFLGWLAHR